MIKLKTKKALQGKLPDEIFKTITIDEYIKQSKGLIWGYLGHENRTNRTDKIVDKLRKDRHAQHIALFLVSSDARHVMDILPRGSSDTKIKRLFIEGIDFVVKESRERLHRNLNSL